MNNIFDSSIEKGVLNTMDFILVFKKCIRYCRSLLKNWIMDTFNINLKKNKRLVDIMNK